MNFNKISTSLCFAFQQYDGEFEVDVLFVNGTKKIMYISVNEIKSLSDDDLAVKIDLAEKFVERRWRKRYMG